MYPTAAATDSVGRVGKKDMAVVIYLASAKTPAETLGKATYKHKRK